MIKYLEHENKTLSYKIINKGNKNTYIRFKDSYIEVSKSKHITDEAVTKLLIINFDKYYNKFNALKENIPNDNEIILEEQTYKLEIISARGFRYETIADVIYCYTSKKNLDDIKKEIYKSHLTKMLEIIKPSLLAVLLANDILERPIKISYFKSKFGSYHRIKDEIKLNLVLAKASINYLYYVLIHEYAHTKVFNHSRDFYDLVSTLMPNYKKYDKNLKYLSIWI